MDEARSTARSSSGERRRPRAARLAQTTAETPGFRRTPAGLASSRGSNGASRVMRDAHEVSPGANVSSAGNGGDDVGSAAGLRAAADRALADEHGRSQWSAGARTRRSPERGAVAAEVRIAASAAVCLYRRRRPPRIPLAIGALVAGAAALGAMFLLLMLMTLLGAGGVGSLGGSGGTPATVEATDAPSALAKKEIPPEYLSDYEQAGRAVPPRLGDPRGDREGRVRPRARPRPGVHAGGRGQLGRAPAGRCSSSRAPGRSTGWSRRRRHARPLEPGGRDLRGRELPARVGRAGRLQEGDLRLQPRRMVRGRGRELGGEVSRRRRPRRPPTAAQPSRPSTAPAPARGRLRTAAWRAKARRRCEFIPGERAELDPADGHLALDPRRGADDGAGDGRGGERAAGTAVRAGRPPGPAGRDRRGLLEHRQLRAVSQRGAADRGNRQRQPARAGLRELGRPRPGPLGDDLRDRRADSRTCSS